MKISACLAGATLLTSVFLSAPTLAQTATPPHSSIKATPDPILIVLESRLKGLFQISQPKATLNFEPAPGNAGSLVAHYRVQKFLVHHADKKGFYSRNAFPELGPNGDGFLLSINVRQNDGQRADVANGVAYPLGTKTVPVMTVTSHNFRDAYWDVHTSAYPCQQGRKMIWVEFLYNANRQKPLRDKIDALISHYVQESSMTLNTAP